MALFFKFIFLGIIFTIGYYAVVLFQDEWLNLLKKVAKLLKKPFKHFVFSTFFLIPFIFLLYGSEAESADVFTILFIFYSSYFSIAYYLYRSNKKYNIKSILHEKTQSPPSENHVQQD